MCNPGQSVLDGIGGAVQAVGGVVSDSVNVVADSADAAWQNPLTKIAVAATAAVATDGFSTLADAAPLVELGTADAIAPAIIADTGLSAPSAWEAFSFSDYVPSFDPSPVADTTPLVESGSVPYTSAVADTGLTVPPSASTWGLSDLGGVSTLKSAASLLGAFFTPTKNALGQNLIFPGQSYATPATGTRYATSPFYGQSATGGYMPPAMFNGVQKPASQLSSLFNPAKPLTGQAAGSNSIPWGIIAAAGAALYALN